MVATIPEIENGDLLEFDSDEIKKEMIAYFKEGMTPSMIQMLLCAKYKGQQRISGMILRHMDAIRNLDEILAQVRK